jgi:hypothetical protein
MRSLVAVALGVIAVAGAGSARAAPDDPLDALAAVDPGCGARAHCIGLAVHVAVTDDSPVATPAWFASQLAAALRHFAPLDLGFRVVSIDALPASAAEIENRKERNALVARVRGRVIHVFLTGRLDDVDRAGQVAYGVTWHARGLRYVIVSTEAWERTLAHELGHVFGLQHSTYPISIMNKSARSEPPMADRTFAEQELAKMRPRIRWLLRRGVYTDRAKPAS